MAKITKDTEWVCNVKSGVVAYVIARYNRSSDGKLIVEGFTGLRKVHWLASSTEAA